MTERKLAQALWYDGRGGVALDDAALDILSDADVRIQARYGALSRGTERLVLTGKVPPGEYARMRCPHQMGDFPGPVKYGYQCVGTVVDGPAELRGQIVFTLHPHQTVFDVPAADVIVLPDGVPPQRAVMAANVETALNVLWDSGASAGDRILVVGGGVVGLLVARLAASLPGAETVLCDINPARAPIAETLGVTFLTPGDLEQEAPFDVAIHASGHPAGLQTAIDHAGLEARIIEASWYGETTTPLALGGAFHSKRLSIISSQVGRLPPVRAPRWSHRRRLEKALNLLEDPAFDVLLAEPVDFSELPEALPRMLLTDGAQVTTPPCPLIRYPAA
jgi:2-desacetyl-2-hydroxyethyl bacteriochlorophyllide A dehydrogenase